jgi:DNA-binding NarL/FixJ family response regulator
MTARRSRQATRVPNAVDAASFAARLNGLEATRQTRRAVSARILILTVHESDQVITEVLDAGAHGYVLKKDAGRTLVEAIGALLGRQEFFTKRVHGVANRRTGTRRSVSPRHTESTV